MKSLVDCSGAFQHQMGWVFAFDSIAYWALGSIAYLAFVSVITASFTEVLVVRKIRTFTGIVVNCQMAGFWFVVS